MKNYLLKIAKTIFMLIIIATFTIPAFASQNPRIRIDGEFVYIPAEDQQPIIVNDRTLVPLRAVMEALGFTVEWTESTQIIVLSKPRQAVFAQIGNYNITVNGDTMLLDVPAQIINSRTMVPLRAISEASGMDVYWDGEYFIVDIMTNYEATAFHLWPVNSSNWPEYLPPHVPGSITIHSEDVFEGLVDLSSPMQFRALFYHIPGEILDLVPHGEGEDLYWGYDPEFMADPVMLLMRFVQVNNISRADFDAAVNRMKESRIELGVDFTDEWHELPNADIIFTFDNDLIRYFYRRQ